MSAAHGTTGRSVGCIRRSRIIYARLFKSEIFTKLLGAFLCDVLHVVLGAELQASRWTCLDTSGLEASADAVGAQRALVNFFRRRIEFGNVIRTPRDAKLAADAVFLLEVDDTVGVLHDRAIGRTGAQATGVGAVHALVFAHEPLDSAVLPLVLVELDQVPEIPARLRHRLVSVVERGRTERHIVPLDARHLAGLATNANCGIDQLADFRVALHVEAGRRPGVSRDLFDLKCLAVAHRLSPTVAPASWLRAGRDAPTTAAGTAALLILFRSSPEIP